MTSAAAYCLQLAFVVPGACWIQVNRLEMTPLRLRESLVHWVLIVTGFVLMFFTLATTIYNQVSGAGEGAKECGW